jgi:glycosyltransferase involved in cell wall biosynthesis
MIPAAMHVLYVHQNYPAQFRYVARHLAKTGRRCTFVSRGEDSLTAEGIERIGYEPAGAASRRAHYCARGFENRIWHCDAVYRALKARPDIKPDLIVGHSGFGTTLLLPELYPGVPILNYFEYYFRPRDPNTDWGFRKDLRDLGWSLSESAYLRNRARNAMILLDLQGCDAAYAPTAFQRSVFPAEYQPKMQVVFDGVDRTLYHGHAERFRPAPGGGVRRRLRIGKRDIPPGTRVVTYVSRGFEAIRGFDIFMRAARRIAELYPDVVFVIVGDDKVEYGHDRRHIDGHPCLRQWLLEREEFDLSRFLFAGRLPQRALAQLLATTDLHIYLTVPYILSWSLMDAMSCGAVILGSSTGPVMEMIHDGRNGLLADFFDVEGIARRAVEVLRDPAAFRPLGRAAERTIEEMYSVEAVVPQMLRMYEATANRTAAAAAPTSVPAPVPASAPARASAPAESTPVLAGTASSSASTITTAP